MAGFLAAAIARVQIRSTHLGRRLAGLLAALDSRGQFQSAHRRDRVATLSAVRETLGRIELVVTGRGTKVVWALSGTAWWLPGCRLLVAFDRGCFCMVQACFNVKGETKISWFPRLGWRRRTYIVVINARGLLPSDLLPRPTPPRRRDSHSPHLVLL